MNPSIRLLIILSLSLVLLQCDNDKKDPPPEPPSCPDGPIGEWQLLGLEGEAIKEIAIHPDDPQTIYAGSEYNFSDAVLGKLFKSCDCGNTWDTLMVSFRSFLDIDVDPKNPNIIYAVSGSVAKSEDNGLTWVLADSGLLVNSTSDIIELVIDPRNTNTLYAVGTTDFGGGRIYKSTNGGRNWSDIRRGYPPTAQTSLALDTAKNIVYVGADQGLLMRSLDGGETWQLTGDSTDNQLVKDIFVDSNSDIYICVALVGIKKSTDQGRTWVDMNEGLTGLFSPFEVRKRFGTDELYAGIGTQDDGYWVWSRSTSTGVWVSLGLKPVMPVSNVDLRISNDGRKLYFGPSGLYVYTFHK